MGSPLGRYDQVCALTQQMINVGLVQLFQKGNKDPIKFAGDTAVGLKEFVFAAPTIVIPNNKDSTNRSKILLVINIAKGKFRYAEPLKPDEDPDDFPGGHIKFLDAAGWAFAVPCDLELQDTTDPTELARLRKELELPGDYGVSRLFVSLRKAATSAIDRRFSNFSSNITGAQVDSLCRVLSNILDKQLGAISYVTFKFSGGSGGGGAPVTYTKEFIPTSMRFQTSVWTDPDTNQSSDGTTGGATLNSLLYCEMLGDRPLPTSGDLWLQPSNWTPGRLIGGQIDPKMPLGRFYIHKRNFFDGWLIPKLKVICAQVNIDIYNHTCWVGWNSQYKWTLDIDLFDWSDSGKSTFNETYRGWVYDDTTIFDEENDWVAATIAMAGSASTRNHATIEYTPGSNRVTMSGFSEINMYCEVWRGVKKYSISHADRISRRLDWSINLDLECCDDGGVQFKISEPWKRYTNVTQQLDLDYIGSKGRFLDAYMESALGSRLDILQGSLAKEMSGMHKLYFPASGVFSLSNPIITETGDFACDIKYNSSASDFSGVLRSVVDGTFTLPTKKSTTDLGGI